jgi:peptidoglycan/LPS O-acetylase OafA/YrhL
MIESVPSPTPHYVPPLTGIRALAALLVLGLHADQNVPTGALSVFPFLGRGYLGVDFFFVLSGYIITHVYLASLAEPSRNAIQIFLWHRFIRLYPVHVTVLTALVALICLVRAVGIPLNNPQEWRMSEILWQLTLLHAWGVLGKPGWNAPSWSISAEWFAYLWFPLLAPILVLVRDRLFAFLIAAAALAATAFAFSAADWSLNTWVGAPALTRVVGEFVCGAALCRAVALSRKPMHSNGDRLGVLAFAAFLLGASFDLPDFALVALLALTILGAALAQSYLAAFLGSRVMVWLGELSYSIYMVHFPALLVIRRLWEHLGFPNWAMPAKALAFAASIGLVIALAALLFYAVERPARMRLRDRLGRLVPPISSSYSGCSKPVKELEIEKRH